MKKNTTYIHILIIASLILAIFFVCIKARNCNKCPLKSEENKTSLRKKRG